MKKVLIVDDTPAALRMLRAELKGPDITILEATSGPQALEIHGREHADLIVAAMHMAGMDGVQLVRAIRADPALRRVPILMFSEHARAGSRERCLAAGANDFVSKPFSRVELLKHVGPLLTIESRRNTQLLAHIELARDDGTVNRLVARIVNVSITGMLIEADVALEVGRELSVSFVVPGSRAQVHAAARVVRRAANRGPGQWGIRFVKLDEATRRALKRYVSS